MRLGIVCVCLVLAGCAGGATNFAKAGDYAAAEREASSRLTSHPKDKEAWRVRIKSVMHQGRFDDATALYHQYFSAMGAHDESLLEDLALITIWQSLRSGTTDAQAKAITIIDRHDLGLFLEDVANKLSSDRPVVVATAAIAIMHYPGAFSQLQQIYKSGDPNIRALVAAGIARKGRGNMKDFLRYPARSKHAKVALAAIPALPDEHLAQLLPLLESSNDRVRAAIVRRLGPALSLDQASALLDDTSKAVVVATLSSLAKGGHTSLIESKLEADPAIALTAAHHLGGTDKAVKVLEQALRNADPRVREHALNVCREVLTRDAALVAFGDAIVDTDPAVRQAAARGLAYFGVTERAKQELRSALVHPDIEVRLAAATELARLGDASGWNALSELAKDDAIQVRALHAHSVGDTITPALVDALAARDEATRLLAADLLIDRT